MRGLIQPLLKIDPGEVKVARRGFTCSHPQIQTRLENIGRTFLGGYHAALKHSDQAVLAEQLEQVELEQRGFAYEGAAMALMLLDGFVRWQERFQRFLRGAGKRHVYMLHVGAGWAYARLPWLRSRLERSIRTLDPVLGWLVIDGFGFHQGYFHWPIAAHSPGTRLSEAARHVYYQGLGRSLWFVRGANPSQISRTIENFDLHYRADAWSGVGIACAYAGGLERPEIEELRGHAGDYAPALAQGAAFAAKARLRAGNPVAHTDVACAVLCGMAPERAAALCDETLARVDRLQPCPYQQWRELLQKSLLLHQAPKHKAEPIFHR
jgi:hypothetical protein